MTVSDLKLSTARYTVTLGNPDDPATWQQLHVQPISADLMRAELTMHRAKQKITDLPFRFGALCAWAALVRTRAIDPVSFDAFMEQAVDVNAGGSADGELETDDALPTPPAPVAG
jgi:hypothetical protein